MLAFRAALLACAIALGACFDPQPDPPLNETGGAAAEGGSPSMGGNSLGPNDGGADAGGAAGEGGSPTVVGGAGGEGGVGGQGGAGGEGGGPLGGGGGSVDGGDPG